MEAVCDFGWDNPAAASWQWLTRTNHHGPISVPTSAEQGCARDSVLSVVLQRAGGISAAVPFKRSSLQMDFPSNGPGYMRSSELRHGLKAIRLLRESTWIRTKSTGPVCWQWPVYYEAWRPFQLGRLGSRLSSSALPVPDVLSL